VVSLPEKPELPDPAPAGSFDELVQRLRLLKIWAGDPSYEKIKDRVNAAWGAAGRPHGELVSKSTVAYCFKLGRRRLNTDLMLGVVQALHPEPGYVARWRQALLVVAGDAAAGSQVQVHDSLPPDLDGFTGRNCELDRLCHAARHGTAVVISAIEGMAGVGKTQLAVRAGHLLHRQQPFPRVLFVNLRGFDPDPAQPPVDPAAVLDGFLRLLDVPAQRIPHGLAERTAAYRDRLAGTRALVILDNAATADQIRPLLPATPGCVVLITSRRRLTDLRPATHLTVDVFTEDEAVQFLTRAVPQVPTGPDPHAAARIARRCGHLPLALSLVAGHIRDTPGWTLTDHADRLDERHHTRHLDGGVELAFSVSYRHVAPEQQRLLRLAALHPGQDLDGYAAAALTGTGLAAAQAGLERLHSAHLLQAPVEGRYGFHDLVRAYAAARAGDEDPPPQRRAALTRLFDFYVATAAAALQTLHPAVARQHPAVPPARTPTPDLTDPEHALGWLDSERPTLVAVAAHTVADWPEHTIRLARTLFRYLDGGHNADAVTVHGHAQRAARRLGDPAGEAHALTDLGYVHLRLGRYGPAAQYLRRAERLLRRADDPAKQARTLANLGFVIEQSGRYREATEHYTRALKLYRRSGDRDGEARALGYLGNLAGRSSDHQASIEYYTQALHLIRESGDRALHAYALCGLGEAEVRQGRYDAAGEHYAEALGMYRQMGNRTGEASALDGLGLVHTRLGRAADATAHHQQALAICRDIGDRNGEAWTLNGLGEAAFADGRTADAIAHHAAAGTVATDIGDRDQQARAHTGLGQAHHAHGDTTLARDHYRRALGLYVGLHRPEADEIRTRLAAAGAGRHRS
jgi:tetratricopeptide (TPR) repeat protein